MKCAILSVGTELLMGQITDTNAVYLSQQLNLLGIDVLYRYTVGDNDRRLTEVLDLAFRDCDLIITTGGLGPTEDDMTKETVTKYMGDVLVENEEAAEGIRQLERDRGYKLSSNNFKQTLLPSRAIVFPTDAGTAPGFALSKEDKMIICLPGPPREMTRMFQLRVKPFLEKEQNSTIFYKELRIFGRGESRVETDIIDLIDAQTDPTIATYAKNTECMIRVASKRPTLEEAEHAVDEVANQIKERIGDYIYSENGDDLIQTVGKLLIENNISISCAESCTGGMFAASLASVSGISAVFERGIVTYTCRAKEEELGVDHDLLERETAVSPNVARQMAEGLAKKTGSDITVSVTGIAGPYDESEDMPAGLIYVGFHWKNRTRVIKLMTGNHDRAWNREYAMMQMFSLIYQGVTGKEMRGPYIKDEFIFEEE